MLTTAVAARADDLTKTADDWTMTVGLGTMSCLYWLSTPQLESEGNAWVLGYWSGRNAANPLDHHVASDTDGNGILMMVHRGCLDHDSEVLSDVTARVYDTAFQDRHAPHALAGGTAGH